MAGASMKSIKLRIRQHAEYPADHQGHGNGGCLQDETRRRKRALRTRPYYTTLHSTLSGIAAATRDFSSPYLQKREEKRVCCVAIAGDRGLAGGYNSQCARGWPPKLLTGEEDCVLPIGKKAGEYFRHRGVATPHRATGSPRENLVGGRLLHTGAPFGGAVPLRSGGCHRAGLYPLEQSPFSRAVCAAAAAAAASRKSPRQADKRPADILYEPDPAPRCSMP